CESFSKIKENQCNTCPHWDLSLPHPFTNRGHSSTFQLFNLSTFHPRRRRARRAFPVASRRAFC
ncbi:MAG: hypothetical protein IK066_01690, partial [Kiritimatiellae bacterium]|nr:hypothetical protein [Kiritimatiellia bacterium]